MVRACRESFGKRLTNSSTITTTVSHSFVQNLSPVPQLCRVLTRAYALLTVKSVDPASRTITGMASTPEVDRSGDIVEPLGITYRNPLPLLLYHDSKKPVGTVTFQRPTSSGLAFTASLPTVDEPGTLRDRIDEAWQSIKAGLLAGVSIGFRSIEEAFNKETGGFRFLKTEILELSLVAIPANASATISAIKTLDLAATGRHSSRDRDTLPDRASR